VTYFGERADWSHDGKRVLFVEKTYGDAYEIDLEAGIIRPMTHHYYHNGYTRALYLSNGDILLSGSRTFDPENHRPARSSTAELWVLSKNLAKAPVALGEFCSEGPAVSRRNLKIAWTVSHNQYPDRLPDGGSQMWMADIDYSGGEPRLANKKLILDNRKLPFKCNLETQNFVPPEETKLTFSAYGYQNTEVMMLDIATGEVTNMSNAPGQYDEPEGIFPDGKFTLVESDRHGGKGSQHDDLYKLALDGSGKLVRLTKFNDGGRFKSTNGVVSDDGRYLAFQVPKSEMIAGVGLGIYIMDLQAAGLR
jgi:Tol biopolymer transport system component